MDLFPKYVNGCCVRGGANLLMLIWKMQGESQLNRLLTVRFPMSL